MSTQETQEILTQQYFEFRGTDDTHVCEIDKPHPPHVIGLYNTVRAGTLEYFCLGREGWRDEDGIYIAISVHYYKAGSPYSASKARGVYMYVKPEFNDPIDAIFFFLPVLSCMDVEWAEKHKCPHYHLYDLIFPWMRHW